MGEVNKLTMISPDPNVEKNREMLLQRSIFGQKKYGFTTADNPLTVKQWLQHALEECLDQANYLQAAITQIEREEGAIAKKGGMVHVQHDQSGL